MKEKPKEYGGGVSCDKCKKILKESDGFWHCRRCKYDVCGKCDKDKDNNKDSKDDCLDADVLAVLFKDPSQKSPPQEKVPLPSSSAPPAPPAPPKIPAPPASK